MDKKTDKLLEEIKKLLILDLIKKGVQSKEIADSLGVDPSIITRLVPRQKNKK